MDLVVIFIFFLGFCNRWDDHDIPVVFEVIILFIFNANQAPLASPESLSKDGNACKKLEVVEEETFLAMGPSEESSDPPKSQQEVRHDAPVVELVGIVDFVSEEPIRVASFSGSAKPPIHVDVPYVTVSGLYNLNRHKAPKASVDFLLREWRIILAFDEPYGCECYSQTGGILHSVENVVLVPCVVVLVQTLCEPPPVGKKADEYFPSE